MPVGSVHCVYASNKLRDSKTLFNERFVYKTMKLIQVLSSLYVLSSRARYVQKNWRFFLQPFLNFLCLPTYTCLPLPPPPLFF